MRAMKKVSILTGFILILIGTLSPAHASGTITITNSGNGQTSTTSGSFTLDESVTVSQNNQTQVDNQSNQTAKTGQNQVSDNQGGVDIQTGDIESQTQITNQGGQNEAQLPKSGLGSEIELVNDGNGRDSANSVQVDQVRVVDVDQNNEVTVNNQITKNLNTGDNQATDNHGGVRIKTGAITEDSQVKNVGVGINKIETIANESTSISASNTGNGRGSQNSISVALHEKTRVEQDNRVNITNVEHKDLNTGGNKCADNHGDCEIETGSINSKTEIVNRGGVNVFVKGKKPAIPEPPPTPPSDQTPVEPPVGGPLPEEKEEPVVPSGPDKPTSLMPEPEEKGPIAKLIEQIIPVAQAAVPEAVQPGQVDGAMTLPVTGLGSAPHVRWIDILFGLNLLVLGVLLRRKFERRPVSL